jgi:hypothetical protein
MTRRNRVRVARWLLSASALVVFFPLLLAIDAEAKIPGTTFCYGGVCHRAYTLEETRKLVGRTEAAVTSFYDDCRFDRHNTCGLTASGAVFRPDLPDNAASPFYPEGTKLLVYNPATRLAAVVRINSAGPYKHGRTLDVSRATAERLGFKQRGVARLEVTVIAAPTPAEARYKKHRIYDPVPGPIGQHASVQHAILELAQPRYQLPEAIALAAALGGTPPGLIPGAVLASLPDIRSPERANPRSGFAGAVDTKTVRAKLAAGQRSAKMGAPPLPVSRQVVIAALEKKPTRVVAITELPSVTGLGFSATTLEKSPELDLVLSEPASAVGQGFTVPALLAVVCDDRTVAVRPAKTHLLTTSATMLRPQSKEGCRGEAYSRTARSRAEPASFPRWAGHGGADTRAVAPGHPE